MTAPERPDEPSDGGPASPFGRSAARHAAPARPPFFRTQRGARLLRDAGILAVIFALGYLGAFVLLNPGPVIAGGKAVPRVIGDRAGTAEETLRAAGFRPRRDGTRAHPEREAGEVIAQDPPEGTVLPEGSVVLLDVSDGRAQAPVPDLEGLEPAAAAVLLRAGGFRLERTERVRSAAPSGTIVGTRPGAGTPRAVGSGVTVLVSE